MRDSLFIVMFFILGVVVSFYQFIPQFFLHNDISTYVLYVLMFIVGIGIGGDKEALDTLRKINYKINAYP